jgi:hypothetical protein
MNCDYREETIARVLQEIRADVTEENSAQMRVLLEAFDIYLERDKRYKGVWKGSGYLGSLFDLRKKITRAWQVFWVGEGDGNIDDGLDIINFAAFFVRNVRSGNRQGNWT